MPEAKNPKFPYFIKRILKKFRMRFSFHYVAYTILFAMVAFSVINIVTATTPNPGHPWIELGDGVFTFTSGQTVTNRTYTFPDANTTVLTTNAVVTVPQGGIGVGTLASNGVLYGNGTGAVLALAVNSGATQCLTQASSAAPAWGSCGGGGTPGGSDTQFQYNNGGSFGGVATFTYDDATDNIIFNDIGGDNDFRIEGDTDTDLFFVDASLDEITVTKTATAAVTDDGLEIAYTTGAGDGSDVYSAFKISGTSANHSASSDKFYGVNIGNLASGDTEGEETAIFVGSSWDNVLVVNATPIINGSGVVQSAGISGSYTGITGTGALDAGSITSNFGAIDVGADNITTSGTVFANDFTRSTGGALSFGNTNATSVSICASAACDTIGIGNAGSDGDNINIGDVDDNITFVGDNSFSLSSSDNVAISNATLTNAAGLLDLNATASGDFIPGAAFSTTLTSTGAITASYGIQNSWESSAVVTGGGVGQTAYGFYNVASKFGGADTATGTYNLYASYNSAINTDRTDAGIVNTYGGYFSALGDTAGTSSAIGAHFTASGADNNYAIIVPSTGGSVGIGDATPLSLFTVGDGDDFQINSTGAIVAATGVTSTGTIALTAAALSYVDLGLVVHNTTAPQGLRLPNAASATPSSPSSGEGYLAWDAAGNQIIAYNGSSWSTVGGGAPAWNSITNPTASQSLTFDAGEETVWIKTATAASTEEGLDFTFTTGAGNGSDVYSIMRLAGTSANHAASSDKFYGLNIANLASADAEGDEAAIFVGTGWDTGILGAGALTVKSTSGDLAFSTITSGNITLAPASTGSIQITSGVTSGTTTTSGLSLVANSLNTGTGVYVASSSLTTGKLIDIALGSAPLTTGTALNIAGATYSHTASETGSLVNIAYTDNSTGVFTTTTNGILITPTINTTTNTTRTFNGLAVAPVYTACGQTSATCTVAGVALATPARTQTASQPVNIYGTNISSGALIQSTGGTGVINWVGHNMQMPNITQTTGTVNSTGIRVIGGTVTSGTAMVLTSDASAGGVRIGAFDTDLTAPALSSTGIRQCIITDNAGTMSFRACGVESHLTLDMGLWNWNSPLSKDTFTDTNATQLTSHTPDTGPGWSVMTTPSQWTIESNQLSRANFINDHAYVDVGQVDMMVCADFTALNGSVSSLLVRRQDGGNYWELYYNFTLGGWQFNVVKSGADYTIGPILKGTTGRACLSALGDVITGTSPSGESYSIVDSFGNTQTKAGVILDGSVGGTPSTIDNWVVVGPQTLPLAAAPGGWDRINDPYGDGSVAMGVTAQTLDWGNLTSTTGLNITGGSAMTAGTLFKIGSATFTHTANETGNLASLLFTDATTTTNTSTTNGLLISPTVNVTSGASGTKTINGLSIAPTFTACTGGSTCNPNGVNIGNVTDGTGITSSAINLGTGWDTLISGTTAGTNIFSFSNSSLTTGGALTVTSCSGCGAGGSTWNGITSPTASQTLTFDAGEETVWTKTATAAATEEGLDFAFTTGAGNGSDVYSIVRLAGTSANHAASSDKFYALNIANLTSADTEGDEAAIFVGTGWDNILDTGALDISQAGVITGATGVSTTTVTASSAIAANGGITFDASTDTLGAFTAAGTIAMGAQALTGSTGIIDYTGFDIDASGNLDALGTLTAGSANTVLTRSTGMIDADAISLYTPALDGASSTINSPSGLEAISDELTLLQGCTDTQVLAWDEGNDYWECATAGGASTLQQAYVAGATIDITSGEGALDIDAQSANVDFEIGQGSDTGDFRVWDGTSDWIFVDESADTISIGAAAGSGINIGATGLTTTVTGDLNVTLGSADEIDITKTAAAAATEEGLEITFTAGAGNGSDVYSLMKLIATSADHSASTDKLYGLNIDSLASADAQGDEVAINVGQGWDAGIRFQDADSSHYVGFAAPTSVTTSATWTLPVAGGVAGCLKTDTSNVMTIGSCGDAKSETFTSNGTYTMPSDAQMVIVDVVGGGGSGGGGGRNAGGVVKTGGGGGGGGVWATKTFSANAVSSPVTVTVPAGTAGGGGATGTGNGTTGAAGANVTFGSLLTGYGGGGGAPGRALVGFSGGGGGGGTLSVGSVGTTAGGVGGGPNAGTAASGFSNFGGGGGGTNGVGGFSAYGGGGGGGSNNNGAVAGFAGGVSLRGGGGGGGGGGVTTGNAAFAGGAGGGSGVAQVGNSGGGGAAGAVNNAGIAGANAASNITTGANGGGGGGGGNGTTAQAGGAGGNGGVPGGGGGGGGGGANAGNGGNGGAGGRGEIKVWTIRGAGAADLAETYSTNEMDLDVADVVSLDPSLNAGVKRSTTPYDPNALGIISTQPNMLMGGEIAPEGVKMVPLALAGRVPVRVSTINGTIKRGDYLTSSSIPGVAMKATKAGVIIGRSLGVFEGPPGEMGIVIAYVETGYYSGNSLVDIASVPGLEPDLSPPVDFSKKLLGKLVSDLAGQDVSFGTTPLNVSDLYIDRLAAAIEIVTPKVTTSKLSTDSIYSGTGSDINLVLSEDGRLVIGSETVSTIINEDGTETTTTLSNPVITFDSLGNATFAGTVSAKEIKVGDVSGIQAITDQINELAQGQVAFTLTAEVMNTLSSALTLAQADILKLQTDLATATTTILGLTTSGEDMDTRIKVVEALLTKNEEGIVTGFSMGTLTVSGNSSFGGEAKFEGLSFFSSTTEFASGVLFKSKTEFVVPPLYNKDSAGYALIKQGDRRVEVAFAEPYIATPVVNTSVTFEEEDLEDDDTRTFFADDIRFIVMGKNQDGFIIVLNKPATRDIRFSWNALAVRDPSVFESIFEGLIIDGTPPPTEETPVPEPTPSPAPDEVNPEPNPTPDPEVTPEPEPEPTPSPDEASESEGGAI